MIPYMRTSQSLDRFLIKPHLIKPTTQQPLDTDLPTSPTIDRAVCWPVFKRKGREEVETMTYKWKPRTRRDRRPQPRQLSCACRTYCAHQFVPDSTRELWRANQLDIALQTKRDRANKRCGSVQKFTSHSLETKRLISSSGQPGTTRSADRLC